MLHQSYLPLLQTGCVGHPFPPTPVHNNLSIILHKDVGHGPLSEVREGDPQRDGCNHAPKWICDMHRHLFLRSVGHDALKVKQLVTMAGCIPPGVRCPLALLPRLPQLVPHHTPRQPVDCAIRNPINDSSLPQYPRQLKGGAHGAQACFPLDSIRCRYPCTRGGMLSPSHQSPEEVKLRLCRDG